MTRSRRPGDPRSPTILCITSAQDLGGAEFVLLDTIAALRERGLRVTVLNLAPTSGGLARILTSRGVEVVFCRVGRFRDPITAVRVLHWFIRRAPLFHLALANDTRALLYAALGCLVRRRPYIWHVHDCIRGAQRFEKAARWLKPAAYIAVSHAVRQTLLEHGCPGEHIYMVHNAVDVDRFHPAADGNGFRRELAIDRKTLLVGILGRIEPLKAVEMLLQAAARLRASLPASLYVVMGDVITDRAHMSEALRYRDSLLALRDRLGLRDQVRFLGRCEDVPRGLAALDILVHTSVNEAFGRVLIEAMAAGKPVVATRVGGVPEIVVEGVTGYLIPPRDVEALASRLQALADPDVRARLGRAARERAVALFSLPKYREQMTAVVTRALARGL
jgi:glycosyltransferase involved in cell wall biosynthesis